MDKPRYKIIIESNIDDIDVSDVKATIETNDECCFNLIEHIVNLLICQGFSKSTIIQSLEDYIEHYNEK